MGTRQSEYSSWGVPSKQTDRRAFAGNDESRPGLGSPKENGMKDATRRATSEVLAQMLAVTAMLVIASFVFYTR